MSPKRFHRYRTNTDTRQSRMIDTYHLNIIHCKIAPSSIVISILIRPCLLLCKHTYNTHGSLLELILAQGSRDRIRHAARRKILCCIPT